MYSFGDIKFRKPVSLRKVGYVLLFALIFSLPLFFLTGEKITSPPLIIIEVGIPLGLGTLASLPVFGGKSLADYVKSCIGFIQESKVWTDLEASSNYGDDELYTDSEFWVSRRREIKILEAIEQAEGAHV